MPTTADVREFLTSAFSAEEIDTLCFDHFPAVYQNFGGGQTKGAKIQQLLEYCQRHHEWPALLQVLYRERPQQFEKVLGDSHPPAPSPDDSRFVGGKGAEGEGVSGGMSLTADEIAIRGDAVGRDKVVTTINGNVYYIYLDAGAGAAAVVRALETGQPSDTTPAPKRLHVDNPFHPAGRINDPALFFGREQLVRELRQELSKRTNVSLVGESQTGKSSLLYYLYATRGEWLVSEAIEYLELQTVLDEADFCEMILQRLGAQGHTLRDLRYALYTRRVILLLDEVERLAEPDISVRLHDLLRSLAQEPNFKMCVASQRPLDKVFPPRGTMSDLHNIFIRKTIGPFTENEARRFLTVRLQGTGIAFAEREVARLIAESQCHPAKLQQAAKALFEEYVNK
jgi:hypothetical protein